MSAKPLRDADWLAERLGVKRFTIYDLAREGRIPVVRVGRTVRFDEDIVESWIRAGGTQPNGDEA
jgi:excisionase family DNA binding protein